jgi:hypothetical protein
MKQIKNLYDPVSYPGLPRRQPFRAAADDLTEWHHEPV